MKQRHISLLLLCLCGALVPLPSCHRTNAASKKDQPAPATSRVEPSPSGPRSLPEKSASTSPQHDLDLRASAMDDSAVGPLIDSLSEHPGDFPSDNFVSNETSYLDAASTLTSPQLRARAYIGVGPEQNYTYISMMHPAMSYIVDIRRSNLLEHLYYRHLLATSSTRYAFLMNLTGRARSCMGVSSPKLASFGELASSLSDLPSRGTGHVAEQVNATLRLMKRLRLHVEPKDRAALTRIAGVFATKGVDVRYTMKGSSRHYPSLRDLLSMTTPDGAQGSFLADEQAYQDLRDLVMANRVLPIVGDFAGEHALRSIGQDMKQRKLTLGVFYMSNVEQYLFEGHVYGKFVKNLGALPTDGRSRAIRVWFDQGRPHPKQRKGHRTTTIVAPLEAQLTRMGSLPPRSFWDVVTAK